MGILISKALDKLFKGAQPKRLVILGLDGAGKTTILYNMRLGQVISTVPTIGFNVETLTYKNLKFTAWDIGGQTNIRSLWHHYFHNTNAVIFVVDSSDTQRIGLAKQTLQRVLNHQELVNVPVLIYANKADLCTENIPSLTQQLGLHKMRNRDWNIQSCCGLDGKGIVDGMQWLCKAVKNKK